MGKGLCAGPTHPTYHILKSTPGLSFFFLAFAWKKNWILSPLTRTLSKPCLSQPHFSGPFTFKVECKREDKYFPMESYAVCKELGRFVLEHYPGAKVQMKEADFVLTVEVRHKIFFIGDKVPGPGGLPAGTTGGGLLLLSGGIDSPVAGIQMAIRGLELKALHFHSYPYTSLEAQEKIKDLAPKLKAYSPNFKLYFLISLPFKNSFKGRPNPNISLCCLEGLW